MIRKTKTNIVYICTEWKFHDFSFTQILREIKFGDFRSAKSAISTHLDFYEYLHFLKVEIDQIKKISEPQK